MSMEHGPLCRERDDIDVEAKLSCERVDQGGLSTEKEGAMLVDPNSRQRCAHLLTFQEHHGEGTLS